MTEIIEIGNATLYHGDCLEILPTLDRVDAVVTDPPYLNLDGSYKRNYQGGVGRKVTVTKTVGDEWTANLEWVPLCESIADKGLICFSTYAGVGPIWGAVSNMKHIALVTWYKRNAAPTGKNVPNHKTEFAWCFRGKPGIKWDALDTMLDIPNINAGCMATERFVDRKTKAIHPTQKPVAVMERLLLAGMNIVCDPFMGLGTTGVACANLGRQFIGIEIERKYFDIACERIGAAYAQGQLFTVDHNEQATDDY